MIRQNILDLKKYTPPLEGRVASGSMLLDFNERTTPPPYRLLEAINKWWTDIGPQKYPEYGDIAQKLALHIGVAEDQILLTNGSSHAVDIVFRAFCGDDNSVAIIPQPSFYVFYILAGLNNASILSPSYTLERGYPLDEVEELADANTKVIVVCNPNNPTGTSLNLYEIECLAKSCSNAIILVDECYWECSGLTALELMQTYENIIIIRSFSKLWGLASLRIGCLISTSKCVEEFKKVSSPYAVNQIASVALGTALEDPSYVYEYLDEVMKGAKPFFENWLDEKGINYWPSRANFLLIDLSHDVYDGLAKCGVLTRKIVGAEKKEYLRISIGTVDQMKILMEALEGIL